VLAYLGLDEVGARRVDHSIVYFDLYPYEERLLLSLETAESPERGGSRQRDLCLCVIPRDLRQPMTCPVQAPLETTKGLALEARLERDGRVALELLPSSQPPDAATRELLGSYQLW
jgi:hypothetical protein